jgi:hypothetical protein
MTIRLETKLEEEKIRANLEQRAAHPKVARLRRII